MLTLDSNSAPPPGRLRELVGVAAHPLNLPRLDASGRKVVGGYGILQPRVVTPLPEGAEVTLFHWLFAGQCGTDPYSAATSEVYQDLFSEGTFTGKGLLHVQAVDAVLSGRLPEERVLSHDLLEGSLARCATTTDTEIEDAPFGCPDVAASRVHRWTRGDWQLLPLPAAGAPLPDAGRSTTGNIQQPASLAGGADLAGTAPAGAAGGWGVSPWAALALVAAAFSGPLMGAVAGFRPSRDDLAKRHFYREAGLDLLRVWCWGSTAWRLALCCSEPGPVVRWMRLCGPCTACA